MIQSQHWFEELSGPGPTVAAYTRVSCSKQVDNNSLAAQEGELGKMKERFKPSGIHWICDAGKSGTTFDRRQMDMILRLARSKKITELWTVDIDRLGRDMKGLILYFLLLCYEGCIIRTPERSYDASGIESIFLFAIKASGAEDSNKSRKESVRRAKSQLFGRKIWKKPIPPGYKREGLWIKKDDAWGPAVTEAYNLFIETKSFAKVLELLNQKYSVLLGHSFTRYRVHRLLTDPVYVGRPSHVGSVVEDTELAFVNEDLFQQCQVIASSIIKRHRPEDPGPIEKLAQEDPVRLIDLLEKNRVGLCHLEDDCGGRMRKNGRDRPREEQILQCKRCPAEIRFATGECDHIQEIDMLVTDTRKEGEVKKRISKKSIREFDKLQDSLSKWII